jgi:hypothetical protein
VRSERSARRSATVTHATQLAGELPERVAKRRAALRREREALAAVLRSYPEAAAARLRALRAEAERAGTRALELGEAGAAARDRLAALPFWRRRERGVLAHDISRLEEERTRLGQARDAALLRAEAIEQGLDGPGRWEAAHPGARERYRALAGESRALERLELERGVASAMVCRAPEQERTSARSPLRERGRSLGLEP